MVFHSKSIENVWMMMVLGTYLYLRRHNPEIALLWGAAHNVQKVSRHGFEMYLAISQNQSLASAFSFQKMLVHHVQRYLRTHVIGLVETLEVLLGFHQYQRAFINIKRLDK